jgi:hypothetical protein
MTPRKKWIIYVFILGLDKESVSSAVEIYP